jgi:hypothetical protein
MENFKVQICGPKDQFENGNVKYVYGEIKKSS